MSADLTALTKTYRTAAKIAAGNDLAKQRAYLVDRFTAEDADGTGENTGASGAAGSTTWQHRGATPEQKMAALVVAIEEIDVEIAAATAEEVAPGRVASLTPRFHSVPH